jgi:gamma-glutamyltranspeptidase/glutathione hydrolase
VFAPAIELAERGFPMTKKGAQWFRASFAGNLSAETFPYPEVRETYMHAGGTEHIEFGRVLRQPALAHSFRLLASQGKAAFYRSGPPWGG